MNHSIYKQAAGFTLVELIVIIILLSILSVVAISRYQGSEDFQLRSVQDEAMGVIRQIQLGRMQSNVSVDDPTNPIELNDYYRLVVLPKCLGARAVCIGSEPAQANSAVVETDSITFSSVTNIEFDLLGNPYPLGQVSPTPILITLTDASGNTASICINEAGYIVEGACLNAI